MRKSIPNSTQNEYWSPVVPVFDLGFFIQERREWTGPGLGVGPRQAIDIANKMV